MTTMTDAQRPDYEKYRQRLELTPEEAKLFQACMSRLGIITPTILSAAVGYGLVRLTPFRPFAKYAALGIGAFGLVTSRMIMAQKCLANIASMPNSTLKDRLLEAGFYGPNKPRSEKQYQDFQPLDAQSGVSSTEEIVFDDYPQMHAYDTYSSDYQPAESADLSESINLSKGISYDELREKNREEFYKKNKQWYAAKAPDRHQDSNTTERVPTPNNASPIEQKNKYGDVWG